MTRSPRILVFALVLTAIPLGAWQLVFKPRNDRDAEMRRQIEARQARLAEVKRAAAAVGELQQQIASLQKAIQSFQSKLPSEKEIDKVLQDLWQLAESNQLVTKSIRTLERTGDNSGDGPYSEQAISMQIEGDFLGLYTFLQALETQPRIMRIRSMDIRKAEKGAEGAVQAGLIMSIFFEHGDKDMPCPTKN